MTKAEEKAQEKAEAIKMLRKLGVKPGTTIYTTVTHVARSGMSRNIRLYIVTKDKSHGRTSNGIFQITGYVADACGFSRTRDMEIKMGGCGMDMCFQAVYILGRTMFPKGGSVELSQRRHQEKREGKTIETDGGYLLDKRDL